MPTLHQIGETGSYLFWCPGCEMGHRIICKGEKAWQWNGDVNKPTFSPSYLTWADDLRCHSYIKDGKIQFLSDCTHKLAGQTVDLPEWDEVDCAD